MYPKLWKNWCLIVIASFLLHSCAKEEAEVTVADGIVANQLISPQNNNGPNNNGPNNGGPNGGPNNDGGPNNGGPNDGPNNGGPMDDDADEFDSMVMRPSVFIQQFIDPSYQTNLFRLIPSPNPTFPGYPSGHSAFASAAAGVFIDFFGNDINFTDRSHEGRTEFRGAPRTFNSFEDLAAENGYSRVPLGVHIEIDCTEGLRLGYEIANGANQHRVQRNGG